MPEVDRLRPHFASGRLETMKLHEKDLSGIPPQTWRFETHLYRSETWTFMNQKEAASRFANRTPILLHTHP